MDALTAQPSRTFKRWVNNPANPTSGVLVPVVFTIRGDLQKAESLLYMAPGVLQKMRYENAQHLPDYRKSVVVGGDGGRWMGVIVSQTKFGVESVDIYVPSIKGERKKKDEERRQWPTVAFYFEDRGGWWVEYALGWGVPRWPVLDPEADETLYVWERSIIGDKTVVHEVLPLPPIGVHTADTGYASYDSGISATAWSPGNDPNPDEILDDLPTPLSGPNIGGTYWNPDTSECYQYCTEGGLCTGACCAGHNDISYSWVDADGNLLTGTLNYAACVGSDLFVHNRMAQWYQEFTDCTCDVAGLVHCDSLENVILDYYEHTYPADGVQTRTSGIRTTAYSPYVADMDGSTPLYTFVTVDSTVTTYIEETWQGVFDPPSYIKLAHENTREADLLLFPTENNRTVNPDTEVGANEYSAVFVKNVEGYADYSAWAVLYVELVNEYNLTHTGTSTCGASFTWDYEPVPPASIVRYHYIATPEGRHLLWQDTASDWATDAYCWMINIYDYHGTPLYVFAYSKDTSVWGDNDGCACYFGAIFRGRLILSDPFRYTDTLGFNIYEAVEKWAKWNWGIAVGAEVIYTASWQSSDPPGLPIGVAP